MRLTLPWAGSNEKSLCSIVGIQRSDIAGSGFHSPERIEGAHQIFLIALWLFCDPFDCSRLVDVPFPLLDP
jgi:hypothetical protein